MCPEPSKPAPKKTPQKATGPTPLTILISSVTASTLLITWAVASPTPIHKGTMDHSGHAHHHETVAGQNSAHGGMLGMSEMAPMPMYFISTWHTTLWFKTWETKSVTAYVMSLLGLVLLGIAYEALACYRSCHLTGNADGVLQEPLVGAESARSRLRAAGNHGKLWAAVLYALNITTGYLLMLAVMTFNTGYFFAVIGGMGIGYYLLFDHTGSKHALARSDACHARLEAQN